MPRDKDLDTIPGVVKNNNQIFEGCLFCDRCDRFIAGLCDQIRPPMFDAGNMHKVSCHLYHAGGGSQ